MTFYLGPLKILSPAPRCCIGKLCTLSFKYTSMLKKIVVKMVHFLVILMIVRLTIICTFKYCAASQELCYASSRQNKRTVINQSCNARSFSFLF